MQTSRPVHFKAIWRMDQQVNWSLIYFEDQGVAQQMAPLGEVLAMMGMERMSTGAYLSAKTGAHQWLLRRDERGVLAGFHDSKLNTLVARTTMARIEQASGRSAATTSMRGAMAGVFVTHAPAPAPDTQQQPFRPRVSEIDLDDFLSDSTPPRPQASAPTDVSWDACVSFIEHTITCAQRFIGRSVSTNYWREAFAARPDLAGQIRFDRRGRIQLARQDVAPSIPSLQHAWEAWVRRCSRIIPNMRDLGRQIGLPPWSETGRNP